jgi:hypothetical protein
MKGTFMMSELEFEMEALELLPAETRLTGGGGLTDGCQFSCQITDVGGCNDWTRLEPC